MYNTYSTRDQIVNSEWLRNSNTWNKYLLNLFYTNNTNPDSQKDIEALCMRRRDQLVVSTFLNLIV